MKDDRKKIIEDVAIEVCVQKDILCSAVWQLLMMTAGAGFGEDGNLCKVSYEKAAKLLEGDTYGQSVVRAAGLVMVVVNELATVVDDDKEEETPDSKFTASVFAVLEKMREMGLTGETHMELNQSDPVQL